MSWTSPGNVPRPSPQRFVGKRRANDGLDDFMQVGQPLNRIGEGLLVDLGVLGADAVAD
jgi:hypothetical protein